MAAVAILDLFCTRLDHPRRVFGGICHCAKFGWNLCSSFENMQVFIFNEFGLKMSIHVSDGVFVQKDLIVQKHFI